MDRYGHLFPGNEKDSAEKLDAFLARGGKLILSGESGMWANKQEFAFDLGAEYSGVNTRATIMSTYVLSAVSAAIAGTLLTANVNSAKYDLGSGYTLAIITAVVLGGTLNTGGKGSIIGTVLASLIICILRYGLPLCFGVSTQNLDLPIGLILVVVVLGREIAGQHMLSHLFKRRRKE